VGADGTTINGTLLRGRTNGILMEQTNPGNYLTWDYSEFDTSAHLAMLYRRDGVEDTSIVLVGGSEFGAFYIGACEDGSAAINTNAGITLSTYRHNEVEYTPGVVTRNTLYDNLMGDFKTIEGVAFEDVSYSTGTLEPFYYPDNAVFNGSGEILGWAVFTNWAEADDVIDYLKFYVTPPAVAPYFRAHLSTGFVTTANTSQEPPFDSIASDELGLLDTDNDWFEVTDTYNGRYATFTVGMSFPAGYRFSAGIARSLNSGSSFTLYADDYQEGFSLTVKRTVLLTTGEIWRPSVFVSGASPTMETANNRTFWECLIHGDATP
jgi:hypothetical protein